jgi:hypothetical protein
MISVRVFLASCVFPVNLCDLCASVVGHPELVEGSPQRN